MQYQRKLVSINEPQNNTNGAALNVLSQCVPILNADTEADTNGNCLPILNDDIQDNPYGHTTRGSDNGQPFSSAFWYFPVHNGIAENNNRPNQECLATVDCEPATLYDI